MLRTIVIEVIWKKRIRNILNKSPNWLNSVNKSRTKPMWPKWKYKGATSAKYVVWITWFTRFINKSYGVWYPLRLTNKLTVFYKLNFFTCGKVPTPVLASVWFQIQTDRRYRSRSEAFLINNKNLRKKCCIKLLSLLTGKA